MPVHLPLHARSVVGVVTLAKKVLSSLPPSLSHNLLVLT